MRSKTINCSRKPIASATHDARHTTESANSGLTKRELPRKDHRADFAARSVADRLNHGELTTSAPRFERRLSDYPGHQSEMTTRQFKDRPPLEFGRCPRQSVEEVMQCFALVSSRVP
jgi:hypothetical protein